MTETRLRIDVWGDVVCPFCYIGDARMEAAIERSGRADRTDVVRHTFELDPDAPTTVSGTLPYLAAKFGVSEAEAAKMEANVAAMAADAGLPYAVDRPKSNTRDMLRLVQYANERGAGYDVMKAVQERVFAGDADAFDHESLVASATKLGLPEDDVRAVLADSTRYADVVESDHRTAVQLGARGVPFTVVGGAFGIPGAASVDGYLDVIEKAWQQIDAAP